MPKDRNQKLLSFALMGCALLAATLTSQAQATQASASHAMPAPTPSMACEPERLAGWFERQRQLTDGNADPFQQVAQAGACAPVAKGASPQVEVRGTIVASRRQAATH